MSDTDYFIRPAGAAKRFGVEVRTIQRWEAAGRFPRRVQIGPLAVAYRSSELDEFAKTLPHAIQRKSATASATEPQAA
jgi:predicted DNA-binding transcriptional regulator AlpA